MAVPPKSPGDNVVSLVLAVSIAGVVEGSSIDSPSGPAIVSAGVDVLTFSFLQVRKLEQP